MNAFTKPIRLFMQLVFLEVTFSERFIAGNQLAMCSTFPRFIRRLTALKCSHRNDDFKMNEIVYNASIRAADACQQQFKSRYWNCSLSTHSKIALQAYPETAFLFAIYSAGLAHSMAFACLQGIIENCKCPLSTRKVYKVTETKTIFEDFCMENNIEYGIAESRKVLQNDKESDPKWKIDEHNKEAGRLALRVKDKDLPLNCRCHGASGACAVRKCIQQLPSFNTISVQVMNKYLNAIYVGSDNNGISPQLIPHNGKQKITPVDLVYNVESPDFCEYDQKTGSLGTKGRICKKDSQGSDSCEKLCCNRGFIEKTTNSTVACRCKFTYCCQVTCDSCQKLTITHYCK
ncbi:protein Wnt-4 [Hydra vulgaris]|uniref:Protein Wnt n=1 Tax=Hydra vulgaris TaxID=6087 RepID=A0ABM4C194_HYDVU